MYRGTVIISTDTTKISSAPLAALLGLNLQTLAEELKSNMGSCRFTRQTPINLTDLIKSVEACENVIET